MAHVGISTYGSLTALMPILGIVLGGFVGQGLGLPLETVTHLRSVAAGLILAVAFFELLPSGSDIRKESGCHQPDTLLVGVIIGASLLISLRILTQKFDLEAFRDRVPYKVLISLGVDFFFDALLIGITVALGRRLSFFLGLALAIEMFTITATVVDFYANIERFDLAQAPSDQTERARTLDEVETAHHSIYLVVGILLLAVILGSIAGYIFTHVFRGQNYFYGLTIFIVVVFAWITLERFLSLEGEPTSPWAAILFTGLGFLAMVPVFLWLRS